MCEPQGGSQLPRNCRRRRLDSMARSAELHCSLLVPAVVTDPDGRSDQYSALDVVARRCWGGALRARLTSSPRLRHLQNMTKSENRLAAVG